MLRCRASRWTSPGARRGSWWSRLADICKSTQIADQQVDGQNSKQADGDVFIQTPSCPLKVLSKKVGKRNVVVKVGGLGSGKVTLTGKGIRKTTKVITKSTVATITAKRSKGTPGKVTVAFDLGRAGEGPQDQQVGRALVGSHGRFSLR